MKIISGSDCFYTKEDGITIRAEFAARFLEGMLAGRTGSSSVNKAYVETAIKYADALIEELNKLVENEN
jgi:hypothetical protein